MNLEFQRYGRNKNTLINNSYIDSGEYRNKFDKITNNKLVNRTLYSISKEMLRHRSGTLLEDMYWIDMSTGQVVASIIDETKEQCIVYTNSVIKAISNRTNLITLHTHPNSMPPSISDFNSSLNNGYVYGLVICHNGKIFKYASAQEISEELYFLYIEKFLRMGNSEYDAQIKALNKLMENFEIFFEEVE